MAEAAGVALERVALAERQGRRVVGEPVGADHGVDRADRVAVVVLGEEPVVARRRRRGRDVAQGETVDFDGSFLYCRGFYTSVTREAGGQGWSTDYPGADNNFSVRLAELTRMQVKLNESYPVGAILGYLEVATDDAVRLDAGARAARQARARPGLLLRQPPGQGQEPPLE